MAVIYVAAHRKCAMPRDPAFRPLLVGAGGKKAEGFLRDDTGENISFKNPNYCELTGLYWIWKNARDEIAGLCHYRRFFCRDLGGELLREPELSGLFGQWDVILPSAVVLHDSVAEVYNADHYLEDLYTCGEVLRRRRPEYVESFNFVMNGNKINPYNMIIARKELLDDYCRWLFPVLSGVEEEVDLKAEKYRDGYQSRLLGFLAERLTRVYMLQQKTRLLELPVRQALDFEIG